jgi:isopenicillin-N epimerase
VRTAAEIRGDFLLDPDIAHLNHGSFGATPLPVLREQEELRAELERSPVEFLGRRLPDLVAEAHAQVGAYVGADPSSLVLVPNATTALNAVARSVPLPRGSEVVITDLEYGAMRLLWEEVARRRRARLVIAHVPLPVRDEAQLVDAVWSAVTSRTRVIFFSHITSETALVLPVQDLCRRARETGIVSVVDGAHGPGQLPLSLDRLGADVYAGNGHKWLCAPKGSAFLHARGDARDWLAPPVVSWGWAAEEDVFHARFGWSGTDDPTAVLSMPAAIAYQQANDWDVLRQRCRGLARRTQEAVQRLTGMEPIAPEPLQAPQMVAFPAPPADADALQRALWERFRVEIPVREVQGRVLVRLSVQAYVKEEDCERLVDALERLL